MNDHAAEIESDGDSPNREILTRDMVGHIPYLRRYARALTQNAADADDLVQNCLVRAMSKLDRFEAGTNLRAWLLAIMHNIFIDGFRKKRRAREVSETEETLSRDLYTRANQMHRVEVSDLSVALARLPVTQRSTLLLIALENLTYEEVARITEVPVGTVRSRLSRARHALMQMVDGKYTDEGPAKLTANPAARPGDGHRSNATRDDAENRAQPALDENQRATPAQTLSPRNASGTGAAGNSSAPNAFLRPIPTTVPPRSVNS